MILINNTKQENKISTRLIQSRWHLLFLTAIWHLGGRCVENQPLKITGTAGRMTMKFLPDVKYHREARNPKTLLT